MDESDNKKDQHSDEFKNQAADLEGEEFLDINPMKKQWKYCGSEVITYVEHELSPFFYGFALISMFAFGWMFLFLLPLAYLLLKNAVHRCSRCLNEIGTRHMFGIPDIRQEILIINLGKCSVVVSRTVGIAVTVVLSIIFLYFSWFHDFGSLDSSTSSRVSVEVMSPWTEYMSDWGSKVVISNGLRANEIFKRKYKNNYMFAQN